MKKIQKLFKNFRAQKPLNKFFIVIAIILGLLLFAIRIHMTSSFYRGSFYISSGKNRGNGSPIMLFCCSTLIVCSYFAMVQNSKSHRKKSLYLTIAVAIIPIIIGVLALIDILNFYFNYL
ncbi:hypothetical protein AF435_04515 [Listeria monocytogenes]|uniref:Uncharacterized protein n=1 Tax=Listeria monocytogenes TaxID=1639 RepID=A0AAN2WFD7_LISMN|nr:hypothetical protein [Listeria monocytogenes]EAC3367754.1 hypothetical protein [Listeria monocytogenes]EAC7084983.1 hypothetical protein [Listeria monocytogenes]EAC8542009.1 hypothetical protein [Listeria monocytogenes]EAC8548010.1 hypothetical protein [Listeria monocytogenes]